MPALQYPPGPRGHPFTGSMPEYARDQLGFLTHCGREYGDLVHIRFGPVRSYLLNHPDLIEQALVTNYRSYVKGPAIRNNRVLFGNGLLSSEGDFWRGQRRLAQPAFRRDRIDGYVDTMVKVAERHTASWQDAGTTDVHETMTRITVDIAARTLFDTDVSDRTSYVGESVRLAQDALHFKITNLFVLRLPEWLPFPVNLALRRAARGLEALVHRTIEERRRSGQDHGDLLSSLLATRDEDGRPMPDRQLRDEVITLLVAGFETSAIALTWSLHLLAEHPEVQDRLAGELDRVLQGRTPNASDRENLTYTEQVVLESMRLYPPAWAIARTAVENTRIGDFSIPRGALVFASQWVTHRDERWFPEPEQFAPERWTPEFMKSLPRHAYFPFGGGPRICIGNTFAMTEAVMALATICRRWRFAPVPEHPIILQPAITLRPKHGVRLRLCKQR